MRIIVDSNRYTDLQRGDQATAQVFRSAREIYLPLIVLAELRAGFAHGRRRDENESLLTQVLNTPRVTVLNPDEQTTYFYADIYAELRRKGTPIPTNDIWIAALARQHRLMLFDRDSDFDHVPMLARVRP